MPQDSPSLRVRPFRPEDSEALATIFYEAVRAVSRDEYSEEQLRAWAPAPPDPTTFLRRAADSRLLLVAVDARARPLAYGDLEADGHIDHLYRHPDAARTGAAALVYDRLEDAARERGMSRLYVEASEPARRFFLKRDFVAVERRDFPLRGTLIHNYMMEKRP